MTWISTDKAIFLFLKGGVSSIGMKEFIFFLSNFFSYIFGAGLSSTMFTLAVKVLALEGAHSFLFVSSMMMWVIRMQQQEYMIL